MACGYQKILHYTVLAGCEKYRVWTGGQQRGYGGWAGAELLLGLLLTHGRQESLLGPHLLRPPLSLRQALQGRGLQGLPPDIS